MNQATAFRIRRVLGAISRLTVPLHIGACYSCGMSWARDSYHVTSWMDGRGCFPLCEWCWEHLTPEQRLPFYMRLVDAWVHDDIHYRQTHPDYKAEDYVERRQLIREAVWAGK